MEFREAVQMFWTRPVKLWCSQKASSCLLQALGEQMDSVFSHGLCFCIKNVLLRVFHISLHPTDLCPEIARTRIDLHFTVYHLIINCLPCFHSYTLGLYVLLLILNLIIWSWLVIMADDQIAPVKCDLIRSCFINALLRYKQNINFVVFTLLKSKMLKSVFLQGF